VLISTKKRGDSWCKDGIITFNCSPDIAVASSSLNLSESLGLGPLTQSFVSYTHPHVVPTNIELVEYESPQQLYAIFDIT
jgi:hypothetical protein